MSSYTPQSPNLSAVPAYAPQSPAVPQSAASYYPPQDSFALPHSSHYDYSAGHSFPHYAQQSFQQPHLVQPPQPMAAAVPDEQKPAPGELENIDVKTKFPVARIKRIVQADEEVGKVAQVTPVVVSKALELFMISLALASAEQAKARNSKRVTGAHLKLAVAKDEQFDFLSDITEKIADAPAASKESKSKRRSDSVDPMDDMDDDAAPKKKGRGRRKKVKSSDDDDED